jgi:hypothetical protein
LVHVMELDFGFTLEFTLLKRIAGQRISVRPQKDVLKRVESSQRRRKWAMRKLMGKFWRLSTGKMKVFSLGLLVFSVLAVNAHADSLSNLALDNFAVLGAQTVTNTGATTLNGNLGVYPGTAITGSGTITLSGTIYTPTVGALGVAQGAQADASSAYTYLTGLSLTGTLGALAGQTVAATGAGTSAVYDFTSGAGLLSSGGVLTLNFGGANNENIVFVTGSTLTANSGSSVLVENAGTNDNVYWAVGSSATIGTSTSFAGNIIALTSVAMQTGATDGCGSVIALNGAVTLDNNTISTGCTITGGSSTSGGTVTPTPIPPGTGTTVPVPEGGSSLLYLSFFLVPIGAKRAFRLGRSV